MRNIFDQYDQPENRLTHALYCTLTQDRSLIRPFLKWLGIDDAPPLRELQIVQQRIPGTPIHSDDEDAGLPDLCVFTTDGWAVFFEMKVQAKLTSAQLRRHVVSAKRSGFDTPHLVAITVEIPNINCPLDVVTIQWRQLYAWFDRKSEGSQWARTFTQYLQVFESRAISSDYEIRGTITMFNGLRFDNENPYTYREGKRLIRLLGDDLQSRKELQDELGIDPRGKRRSAITDDDGNRVWDYLPLKIARGSDFIKFPHLTIGISEYKVVTAITIPNGVSGGFRTKLKDLRDEGFLKLVCEIEQQLRAINRRSPSAIPGMYATQRHYRSQRSTPIVDGNIHVDLRTCVKSRASSVKYQPEWAESLYRVLVNKRSNIQFGVQMQFDYGCKIVRSHNAIPLFADSWKAMKPLLEFVLEH